MKTLLAMLFLLFIAASPAFAADIEITTPFLLNAWGSSGWRACADTDGGAAAVDQYCKYAGYNGVAGNGCNYFTSTISDRYSWTPQPASPFMSQGSNRGTGTAIDKVRCNTAFDLLLSLQGRLTDNNYIPAADGQHTFQFYFYDAATGGSQLYDSGPLQLVTTQGIWKTNLGLLGSVDFSKQLWVEIKADGQTMSPRVELTHSAYSAASRRLLPTDYPVLFKSYGGGKGIFWNSLLGTSSHIDTETNGNLWLSGGTDSSKSVTVEGGSFNVNTNSPPSAPKGAFKINSAGHAEFWGGWYNGANGPQRPLFIGGSGSVGYDRFDIWTDYVSGSNYGTFLFGSSQAANQYALSGILLQANNIFMQREGFVLAQFDTVNKVATINGQVDIAKNDGTDGGGVFLKNSVNGKGWLISDRANANDDLTFYQYSGSSFQTVPYLKIYAASGRGEFSDGLNSLGRLDIDVSQYGNDEVLRLTSPSGATNAPTIQAANKPELRIKTLVDLDPSTAGTQTGGAALSTGPLTIDLQSRSTSGSQLSAGRDAINIIASADNSFASILTNKNELRLWSTGRNGLADLYAKSINGEGDITSGFSGGFNRLYAWQGFVKKKALLDGEGGYQIYNLDLVPGIGSGSLAPNTFGTVTVKRYIDITALTWSESMVSFSCSVYFKPPSGQYVSFIRIENPGGRTMCQAYVGEDPRNPGPITANNIDDTDTSYFVNGEYSLVMRFTVPLGTMEGPVKWQQFVQSVGADLILKTKRNI